MYNIIMAVLIIGCVIVCMNIVKELMYLMFPLEEVNLEEVAEQAYIYNVEEYILNHCNKCDYKKECPIFNGKGECFVADMANDLDKLKYNKMEEKESGI